MPGKADKKGELEVPCFNEIILKKLLASYVAYSEELNCRPSPDIIVYIKKCLEENASFNKLIVRPIDRDLKAEDKIHKSLAIAESCKDLEAITDLKLKLKSLFAPISLEPIMRPLNELQLSTCKSVIIIDTPLYYSDVVLLTNWTKMSQNKVKKIEIEDCCIQVDSLRKFATCFNLQVNLTSICFDYNEFGDPGCIEICRGLQNNRTLLSLSLNYCGLTQVSGAYLGQILSTTALKDLFLDGNDLRCFGVKDLIRVVSEEAEKMAAQRLAEKNLKEQEKQRLREQGIIDDDEPKKKKKGKKGGKKKKVKEPPMVGPYVTKLHLADNGIDYYEEGGNKINSMQIIHDTIALFVKLIEYSPEIEEIDIHNNTIGNMSASLIVNALEMRHLKKVGSLAVRVSEKIEPELFSTILKLSKKVKKKKGGKRKGGAKEVIFENEKSMETFERILLSSMSQSLSLLDNESIQKQAVRLVSMEPSFFDLGQMFDTEEFLRDSNDKELLSLEQMKQMKEKKHEDDLAMNRDRYSDRYTPSLFIPETKLNNV